MGLPGKVTIGGLTFKVEIVEGLYVDFKTLSFGLHNTCKFQVAKQAHPTLAKSELFGQLYVFIAEQVCGTSDDRDLIKVAGRTFFGLLRDNPKLIDVSEPIWGIDKLRFMSRIYRLYKRPGTQPCLATLEHNQLYIDITEVAKLDVQWLTLYHELIHMVRMFLGQDLRQIEGAESEGEEERIVDDTAFYFLALMSQNDMRWMLEDDVEINAPNAPAPTIQENHNG